ncbi:hypothetical protein B0I37DRAFT_374062 [Chaetomium sp. MPI-CAGE-AT-0009]|nr:hypothetical protein B0I37DRAFT_374062 [Chaetomium sp. MPI-CAGE-AT-0009]
MMLALVAGTLARLASLGLHPASLFSGARVTRSLRRWCFSSHFSRVTIHLYTPHCILIKIPTYNHTLPSTKRPSKTALLLG